MKVVLLGAAGGIGQALALMLTTRLPKNCTLSLYDIAPMIEGIALDLNHIPVSTKICGSYIQDMTHVLHGASIVLIVAGVSRKPGMDRADLFNVNAGIVRQLVNHVAIHAPQALINIITNPINSMVPIAAGTLTHAGIYQPNKLFGITTLDVIRANRFVADMKGLSPDHIEVPIVGGHSGVTILPLLSQVPDITFSTEEICILTQRIRNAGTEVVIAKAGMGSATLSMGYAAARFTMSLIWALQGRQGIVECAYIENNTSFSRFFAQPVLLGPQGISARRPLGILSSFEQQELQNMRDKLNNDITLGEQFIQKYPMSSCNTL
ncbi:malate dehydrogenase [Candidatus Curculioniphilus buchneri]|uniref:malate dehydrogenase n=1 Tax=Candidatus Curculioniphilus buchneri TaxID=690594 RepID=UPI00376F43DD